MAAVAIRLIGPRIPLILKTTLLHSLSLTDETVWDLRTAVIVTTLRSILSEPLTSIDRQQRFSLKDPGVQGPIWISRVTFPAPENELRQLVFDVIDQLKEHGSETYPRPELAPVEAEWTGFRAGVGLRAPEPKDLTEEDKYMKLMSEVGADSVVCYFHGGAYYLMDPASHRIVNRKLTRLTKGRALNVRYRLAPQHPFPAAFLDCLIAYLSLVYPPTNSLHEPISPGNVVFAGDSAGGNMALALTIFILHLHKTGQATVQWHGQNVHVPLPGGVTTNSAWCDLTRSSPSIFSKAHYDYLPAPTSQPIHPPACKIWPSTPPRAHIYCDGSMVCHPLVSPLAASPELWRGAPPMYFGCGEEMLDDEIRIMAQRAHKVGVKVKYETFEAMPHCFAILLDWRTPRSAEMFKSWANFITKSTEYANTAEAEAQSGLTGGSWIEYKTGEVTELNLDNLTELKDTEVKAAMEREKERLIEQFEESLTNREAKL